MSKRVKITYAIDLDEVPNQTQKLYGEAIQWLRSSLDKLMEVSFDDDTNPHQTLEKIDKARRTLASIDQRLDDCAYIISGYHNAKLDTETPPPQQEELSQSEIENVMNEQLRRLEDQQSKILSTKGGDE